MASSSSANSCCPPLASADAIVVHHDRSRSSFSHCVVLVLLALTLVLYHRERLGKPDLTETQLCQYFRDNLKKDSTDDYFNLEDWDKSDYQNRCIVTGLSKDTTIEELDELFCKAGKIVESKIIKDKKSGEFEGFGFVSFEYEMSMFDVIQLFNGHVLGGHTLTVFKSINHGYPGTKDRRRSDVPPGTKDDEGPHSADAHGSSGDSKL
ncbi:hypothetical protein RIF29_24795 [Crotalaria pallida]|uniref:RRM domain-containing protein n=1 Tax=Crotalaria pallida TaxID=3830 RepID=A0AAN9I0I1_CROPI